MDSLVEQNQSSAIEKTKEDKIFISLQDSSIVVLSISFVKSIGWLPASILAHSEMIVDWMGKKMIHLDLDGKSFKEVVSLLQGVSKVEELAKSILEGKNNLLIPTARYISCLDLVEQLETFISNQET